MIDTQRARQPQWQPIDTAPKCGKRILGFYSTGGFMAVIMYIGGDFGSEFDTIGAHDPTHWILLPDKPETIKKFIGETK